MQSCCCCYCLGKSLQTILALVTLDMSPNWQISGAFVTWAKAAVCQYTKYASLLMEILRVFITLCIADVLKDEICYR